MKKRVWILFKCYIWTIFSFAIIVVNYDFGNYKLSILGGFLLGFWFNEFLQELGKENKQ